MALIRFIVFRPLLRLPRMLLPKLPRRRKQLPPRLRLPLSPQPRPLSRPLLRLPRLLPLRLPPKVLLSPPLSRQRRRRCVIIHKLFLSFAFRANNIFQKEEKTEEKPKSPKVSRRLSARVGDFFKIKPHKEAHVPAKVDEAEADAPPKIDEPAPVAPLENPAADAAAAPAAEAPKAEEPKTEAPPAAPQVAAAA